MERNKLIFKSVSKEFLHPNLKNYLSKRIVKSVQYDTQQRKFVYKSKGGQLQWRGGIHSFIKWRHFGKEAAKIKRRRYKTKKKGSSITIGKAVDDAIEVVVAGNGERPRKFNKYAENLLNYLEENGYAVQATQIPVILGNLNRVTTADLITTTKDKKGLILWEVKTGEPVRKRGHFMKSPLGAVPATRKNHWYLQVMYTYLGLQNMGLEIDSYHVVQIYEYENLGKRTMRVVRLDPKPWVKLFESTAKGWITGVLERKKDAEPDIREKFRGTKRKRRRKPVVIEHPLVVRAREEKKKRSKKKRKTQSRNTVKIDLT